MADISQRMLVCHPDDESKYLPWADLASRYGFTVKVSTMVKPGKAYIVDLGALDTLTDLTIEDFDG